MADSLEKKMKKGYNVALHGIRESEGSKKIAESIMENGLTLANGVQSIRSTTVQLGDEHRNHNFRNELVYYLENYRFGVYSEGYNVIVSTPTVIQNSKGDMLFLGDPYTGKDRQDLASGGQQYEVTCILDIVCSKLGKIPSEFIYGYVRPESGEIIKNSNHYSRYCDDMKKQDDLFEVIRDSLTETEIDISEAIAKGDCQKLEMYKKLLKQFNLPELLGIIEKAEKQYGFNKAQDVEFD